FDQLDEAPRLSPQFDEGRELRLPARPALMDDELLRDAPPHIRPEVVFDQSERQVDARRNPRRGPDVVVPDENAFGVQLHLRVAALEPLRAVPVGGGTLAVEQARLRKQEGSGADTGDTPRRHAP